MVLRVFIFAFLFLISSFSFAVKYNGHIHSYVIKIDTNSSENFSEIINEIKNDRNNCEFMGETYSTFEYIILGMMVSRNSMDCNRLSFIEEIMSDEIDQFQSKNLKGLWFYYHNDGEGIKQLISETKKDTMSKSFLPSLQLALEVSNHGSYSSLSEFRTYRDDVFERYSDIRGDSQNNFKLLLPLNEIVYQWCKLYKKDFKKKSFEYFTNALSDGMERFTLNSYIFTITNYNPECTLEDGFIDPRKFAFSYRYEIGIYDFRPFNGGEGCFNGMKKK